MTELAHLGVATHHTRVESWECDFNHHWNARFYTRAMQHACERAHVLDGRDNPGTFAISTRILRFHRELFSSAAVEVRSMRLADGPLADWTVHLLLSEDRLSAAAVERSATPLAVLPAVAAETLKAALPRSTAAPPADWYASMPGVLMTEAGAVRPADLDHHGALIADEIVHRSNAGVHFQLDRIGFTPAFTKATGIGRMAVEQILVPEGTCRPGTLLRVRSGLGDIREKSFRSVQRIETVAGEPIASVHRQVVTVDLEARKAVPLPDFLRALAG